MAWVVSFGKVAAKMARSTDGLQTLDDWLSEEGIKDEVTAAAEKRIAAMEDGWIEWKGGVSPVKTSEEVEVRYRAPPNLLKGTRIEWPQFGWTFNWSHDGQDDDIIAYRIVT